MELNTSTSLKYFTLAAEQGLDIAQNHLGILYQNGTGVEHNKEKAAWWFKLAAEQGHTQAQYNLGLCYMNGWGVEQHQQNAMQWFLEANKKGYRKAAEKLEELQPSDSLILTDPKGTGRL